MFLKVVTVFCCLALISGTEFEDCGSTAEDVALDFEGCDVPPCLVEQGGTYLGQISFTATDDDETVTNKITAAIGGLETPWPGLDLDGCNNLEVGGNPCPVVTGEQYLWELDVEILSEYPKITTLATIQLLGEEETPIVCLKIPVTIV